MTSSILSNVSLIFCAFCFGLMDIFRTDKLLGFEGVVGLGGAKNVRIFEGETLPSRTKTIQNLPACSECRDFMRCPYFFAGAPRQVPQHEHQPEGQLSHKPAHEIEQLMHLHLLVIENIILTSQGSEGSHHRGISCSQ